MFAFTHSNLIDSLERYLSEDRPEYAYIVLYQYLLRKGNYGVAESEFDRSYSPGKRRLHTALFLEFIKPFADQFEMFHSGVAVGKLKNWLKQNNLIVLLMLIDYLLHEKPIEIMTKYDELYNPSELNDYYYILTHRSSSNRDIKAANQSGDVATVVRWNFVVKKHHDDFSVMVKDIQSDYKSLWEQRMSDENNKIKVMSFEPHRTEYEVDTCYKSCLFSFTGYKDPISGEKLINSMSAASDSGASILIFPELSVTKDIRTEMQVWLSSGKHKLLLVVAGSWHVIDDDDQQKFNELVVYDSIGREVVRHQKMTKFSYRMNAEAQEGSIELEITEGISLGDTFTIVQMPFGSSLFLICKDFCDKLSNLSTGIKLAHPEFIFLPTMGDHRTMEAHEKSYSQLSVGISPSVVISNQTPLSTNGATNHPGVLYPGKHVISGGVAHQKMEFVKGKVITVELCQSWL